MRLNFHFSMVFLNKHKPEQVATNISFPAGLMSSASSSFSGSGSQSYTHASDSADSISSGLEPNTTVIDHQSDRDLHSPQSQPPLARDVAILDSSRVYETIDSESQPEVVLDIPQYEFTQSLPHSDSEHIPPQLHPMVTRSRSGISKVKTPYVGHVSSTNFSSTQSADTMSGGLSVKPVSEPRSVDEALKRPLWR